MAQLMIELQWLIRVRVHLIELFMVGAVRALDMGIEFRRLRREHEQGELFLLAGKLEFRGEIASPAYLEGFHRERKTFHNGIEGTRCGAPSRAPRSLYVI